MKTTLKVAALTKSEMMNRSEKNYNPAIWEKRIRELSNYKETKFYVREKGNGSFDYAVFYASYILESGLHLFLEFSPFCACLESRGFVRVEIDDEGNVYSNLFMDPQGKTGRADNCPANRKMFAASGIMVSSSI